MAVLLVFVVLAVSVLLVLAVATVASFVPTSILSAMVFLVVLLSQIAEGGYSSRLRTVRGDRRQEACAVCEFFGGIDVEGGRGCDEGSSEEKPGLHF